MPAGVLPFWMTCAMVSLYFPAVVLYIFLQISSGIFLYNAHGACAGSGFRFHFLFLSFAVQVQLFLTFAIQHFIFQI